MENWHAKSESTIKTIKKDMSSSKISNLSQNQKDEILVKLQKSYPNVFKVLTS